MKLFPEDPKFFDLFQQQASLIEEMCRQFLDMARNFENLESRYQGIDHVENQGDDLFHDLTARTSRTFVTPIDREDIHLIGSRMDDILDLVQGAAQRMKLFEIRHCAASAREMAELMVACSEVLSQGIRRLPRFEDISDLRHKMHDLEQKGDVVSRQAIAELYKGCREVPDVVNLIMWKEIIETLEEAVDKFEDVFDVVEGVVIKHA